MRFATESVSSARDDNLLVGSAHLEARALLQPFQGWGFSFPTHLFAVGSTRIGSSAYPLLVKTARSGALLSQKGYQTSGIKR
jgi:hypothetical protein